MPGAGAGAGAAVTGHSEPEPEPEPKCFPGAGAGAGAVQNIDGSASLLVSLLPFLSSLSLPLVFSFNYFPSFFLLSLRCL